jgi:hypothetical protein
MPRRRWFASKSAQAEPCAHGNRGFHPCPLELPLDLAATHFGLMVTTVRGGVIHRLDFSANSLDFLGFSPRMHGQKSLVLRKTPPINQCPPIFSKSSSSLEEPSNGSDLDSQSRTSWHRPVSKTSDSLWKRVTNHCELSCSSITRSEYISATGPHGVGTDCTSW